jgi:hypothetical protein
MAAPRNNTNARGKRTPNPRISLSMGISGELRELFSRYLTNEGVEPSEEHIKAQARAWAYANWEARLREGLERQEQAIVI